ncbi:MAG: hypothetical protein PWQ96_2009 [Clostridia bacterium]|nr:hypothetical protein [Clostridia bacterium]
MLIVQIIHNILQNLFLVFSCFEVVDVKVPWKRGIVFAVHTIILLIFMVIMLKSFITKATTIQVISATLSALGILVFTEAFFIINIFRFFNLDIVQVMSDVFLYTMMFFISNLGFLVLLIANKLGGFAIKV